MKNLISLAATLVLLCHLANAQQNYWPKQIEVDDVIITIYSPEPEGFEDNILDARAAFSIFDKQHLPVFGAMWFQCRVLTDVGSNHVYFTDIKLKNAEFPNASVANIKELQEIIASQVEHWNFNSNLKKFYAAIQEFENSNKIYEELRNHPPAIFYSDSPAVLVYIDGEPILQNISGSELYQFVVNTPHFIVKSSSDKTFYLKGGQWWYASENPTRSWSPISTPPNHIMLLAEKASKLDVKNANENKKSGQQPKLIVSIEPAELIQTLGEPQIEQIYENLFSVSNTNDEIIFDSRSDYYFILLSGRWYKTKYLIRGPWAYVPPKELPKVFGEIPPTSSFAHIRLSVPGTSEAISAALDNGIPQTAVVDRKKAKMQAQYDGEPVFVPIDGTGLLYAENTAVSVIRDTVSGKFYAVDQAIWFMADSAQGPWSVADHYPKDVTKIPPTYPVYNMKFVRIYDFSENIVYVGYTGGYLGTFLYQGVLCYGTGYKFKSWFGNTYIPRPSTYGFGTRKKSTKKKSNVSFHAAVGPGGPMMGVGFGGYPGFNYGLGFGPGGFYPHFGYGWGGYNPYYGFGAYQAWNNMAYNQFYYAGQTDKVYADVVEEKPIDLTNIYNNRPEGIIRTENAIRNDPMKPIILEEKKEVPSDLYVDEDGKIFKLDRQGNWYEQTNTNNWKEVNNSPRQ